MSTQCIVRYRCVVCEVSNCLTFDLMKLERNRPISEQLRVAVWYLHKEYDHDGIQCGAAELVCADVDAVKGLRDVRFVFLPGFPWYAVGQTRESVISEALAEMDWERDGQYQAERIIASAR